MKKFIIFPLILLAVTILIYPLPLVTVKAADSYLRVITDDTPFYKNVADQTPTFYLPYTYYVKNLGSIDEFTHVEVYGQNGVAAIDGFVPTDMLFYDGLSVDNPFVSLSLKTQNTAILYADIALTQPVLYLFDDRTLSYYGKASLDGKNIYYVGYNDRLGYVKEDNVYPFSIPNHPNELTFIVPEEPVVPPKNEQLDPTKDDYVVLKAAIVVCLILAGVIALVFVVKNRPNKNVAISFYDDNDYE